MVFRIWDSFICLEWIVFFFFAQICACLSSPYGFGSGVLHLFITQRGEWGGGGGSAADIQGQPWTSRGSRGSYLQVSCSILWALGRCVLFVYLFCLPSDRLNVNEICHFVVSKCSKKKKKDWFSEALAFQYSLSFSLWELKTCSLFMIVLVDLTPGWM